MLLRLIPDDTKIPFMRFERFALPTAGVMVVISLVLFFSIGLNLGIDFKGGTLIEVENTVGDANIGEIRQELNGLGLGDVQVQEFGKPNNVLIRVEAQPGDGDAQQEAVRAIQNALGFETYEYLRVEVVGPTISGELARTGAIAVIVTLIGVLIYIWFRFEWQFAIGAIISLINDVILTLGFFSLTQIEFNISSIAAILTIVGYSLNDTVVIYDRVRELLRKYKQMRLPDLVDLAINQTLTRTILTSVTTLLALGALFFFGGAIIRSFTAAMIWGVFIGTLSTIIVSTPALILLRVRPDSTASTASADSAA